MSVRHVVMWKVTAEAANQLPELAGELRDLEDTVPAVETIEVGLNDVAVPGNWDMVLIANLPDEEALSDYQTHPNHVAVAQKIKAIATSRSAVDFTV